MGLQNVNRDIRIKLALQDEVCESVEWINMAQFRGQLLFLVNTVLSHPVFKTSNVVTYCDSRHINKKSYVLLKGPGVA